MSGRGDSRSQGSSAAARLHRRRRLVALAAVAAGAALAWVLLAGAPSYEVHAVFDRVNGLVEGADVEVAGVRVGEVESIELGDGGRALPDVTMRIDSDYHLREGAVASIRAPSAAGQVNRVIALHNGGESGADGDGEELEDGATLGLAATDQPVETDQVLATLDARTRSQVAATLAGLDRATAGRGGALASTLRESAGLFGRASAVSRQLDADGESLRTALEASRDVVGTLASDPHRLGATADRVAALLDVTSARQSALAASVDGLPAALQTPQTALERLRGTIPELRALVADAGPGIEALVPFAEDLEPAIESARPVVADARGLITEAPTQMDTIRPLASDATSLLGDLTPALTSAGPILDEARVRTPDFFSFFANWADFTSVYDANGHAARVGLVLPPAPNNLIGPSDNGAGSLEAPFIRTPGVLEGEPWDDYRDSFIGGDG